MAQAVDVDEVQAAWNDICADNPTNNFYLCKLKGGKGSELEIAHSGNGGLHDMCDILKDSSSEIYFGLLRVDAKDESNSSRAKFVYVRFVGTTVGVMKKAKLTPQLATIGENFPVKHLTIDLTEELTNFDVQALAKEFLRVGGAHKPDRYVFGNPLEDGTPQEYQVNQ